MLCIVSTAHLQTARLGSSGSSVCWRMWQRRWGMFQQRQRETPTTNMVCPPLLPPSMYVSCVCQFQKKGCPGHFHSCFLVTDLLILSLAHPDYSFEVKIQSQDQMGLPSSVYQKEWCVNFITKNIQNLAVKFTVAVRSASPDSSCYETPPPRVA